VYEKWRLAIGTVPDDVLDEAKNSTGFSFSYEGTGSSEGKKRLARGSTDLAGSDSALSAAEKNATPGVWFVPSLAGAIAIGYNLPATLGLNDTDPHKSLKIPRELLARIFLGQVKEWRELAEWNPSLTNVTAKISVIVRSDGSGTTSVLTEALSKFSQDWASKVGTSSLPKWPQNVTAYKGEGNAGAARQILIHEYAIGYLSLSDAVAWQVSVALVSNKAGVFSYPTVEAVKAAMGETAIRMQQEVAKGSRVFFSSIVDPSGQDAYPIATFTYLAFDEARLVNTIGGCQTLFDITYLLHWILTNDRASVIASESYFCPLSAAMKDAMLVLLSKLAPKTCGKRPILDDVIAKSMPPPACNPGEMRQLFNESTEARLKVRQCTRCDPGFFSSSGLASRCSSCLPGYFQARPQPTTPIVDPSFHVPQLERFAGRLYRGS
jgi:phosphate transport system substrate-binding protein